jgi:hypothetical protein
MNEPPVAVAQLSGESQSFLEIAMSFRTERRFSLSRCLSAVAALAITVTIVFGLDALSDHYSAATVAKAPAQPVVVAKR